MNPKLLKSRIQNRLWGVAQRDPTIVSATLAGSFLDEPTLDGISDIDLIVVVDQLNAVHFERLVAAFDDALREELAAVGYGLRINPTLGPLKFNDPRTAVLHLMLYSHEAHVEHAIDSPFTCYDWQRSLAHCKRSLGEVFPVFNLQPNHFMGSRRSVSDYLHDFRAGVVSYRELDCSADGYREIKRTKSMNQRDRHEFAYHILRFLMQNLVKLVRRANLSLGGAPLLAEYFLVFPDRETEIRRYFSALRTMKRSGDFAEPLDDLESGLRMFLEAFETQFRRTFVTQAKRHVAFRHGPTALNYDVSGDRVFLGRTDPPLLPVASEAWKTLAAQVADVAPEAAFSSPMMRCRQSCDALSEHGHMPGVECDDRLQEIDYGALEGLSVTQSRATHPELFAAWGRREDPAFPGGENTQAVARRAQAFAREHWRAEHCNSVTCTHNVVLRCLVGQALGIVPDAWHRIDVPHLAPITFVSTRDFGLFADIPPETARTMFRGFATPPKAKAA